MSNAASPAASQADKKAGEVNYQFCPECSNLLYPKEDRERERLVFICKACTSVQEHESACTYRNQIASVVTETAGVTTDVTNDPTLPRALQQQCPRCHERGAVYFQSQQRAAETGMKLYYVCVACSHLYTTEKKKD